jgi:serine/threonine protein kinase
MPLEWKEDGSRALTINGVTYTIAAEDFIKHLGEGAFGIIYKAFCHHDQSYYAIKQIDKDSDKFSFVSFEREVRIMEFNYKLTLSEKETHLVYSVAKENKKEERYALIVMPFYDGGTLEAYLKATYSKNSNIYMSEAEAIEIIRQLLIGLSPLQKNEICHRDLKGENIFLKKVISNSPFAYSLAIGDFGISKEMVQEEEQTRSVGTLLTSAPEVDTSSKYSIKSDVYSIGAIIYRLLNNFYFAELKLPKSTECINVYNNKVSIFMMYVIEGCLQDVENRFNWPELCKLFNIGSLKDSDINEFHYIPYEEVDQDKNVYFHKFTRKLIFEEGNLKARLLTYYLNKGNSSVIVDGIKNIFDRTIKEQKIEQFNIKTPTKKNYKDEVVFPFSTQSSAKLNTSTITMNNSTLTKSESGWITDLIICAPYRTYELYTQLSSPNDGYMSLKPLARNILINKGTYTIFSKTNYADEFTNVESSHLQNIIIYKVDISRELINCIAALLLKKPTVKIVIFHFTISEENAATLSSMMLHSKSDGIYIRTLMIQGGHMKQFQEQMRF